MSSLRPYLRICVPALLLPALFSLSGCHESPPPPHRGQPPAYDSMHRPDRYYPARHTPDRHRPDQHHPGNRPDGNRPHSPRGHYGESAPYQNSHPNHR